MNVLEQLLELSTYIITEETVRGYGYPTGKLLTLT